ncbi:MAG: Fic family protein [Anaerolineae bacterium]
MNIQKFQKSSAGKLIRSLNGYHTFIPHPLPPKISLDDINLIKLLTNAERALGELAGLGYLIPNADFLVIPYTRLEAVASSKIEGTQASLSDLFFFEAAQETPKSRDDVIEVKNYLNALNYGLKRLDTLPLSLKLVREIHRILMDDVRGGTSDKTPGDFRRSQNWIGPAGCTLDSATFVPPPHEEILNLLGDWEKFIHERDSLPLLIQCAYMHYQFETIHPFLDGNGRVGRLLITLFLCERKALPYPLLYLSAYFERYRDEYLDSLLAVSRDGDWKRWLQFFLQGVMTQSHHAIESAKRIVNQRENYRQLLQQGKSSASVLSLLDIMFTSPYLNLQQASEKLNVSFNTAKKSMQQLEDLGIVHEATGQRRNRIYFAKRLLELLVENDPNKLTS